jgi:beta-mannosidase
MFRKKEVFFIYLFLFVSNVTAQTLQQKLNTHWKFKKQTEQKYYKATVPGCVHTDLLANKLISDPFYRANETKLQWINTTNWEYETRFSITDKIWQQQHIDLIFEGLDTYAKIYLNNQLVLETNNMFRPWKLNLKNITQQKNNTLKIIFLAAQNTVDSLAKKDLPLVIPDNARLYARKAAYQFGWDFAPKLTTCGIWKKVYIQGWSDLNIEHISHHTLALDSSKVTMEVESQVQSDSAKEVNLHIFLDGTKHYLVTDLMYAKKHFIKEGFNVLKDTITITKPQLWNANGTGIQNTYSLSVDIGSASLSKTIGLRTIELITKPDSVSDFAELKNKNGTGFYFKVNGKPLYIKGANFVPADMFPSRVKKETYKALVNAAKEANMNMLRVWGGGIYEDETFYDLCDAAGILVWQDFMFAGAMPPTDTAFVNNVKEEAIYQVQRLQHHPSIALWCGNNEIEEAWHNWGWQKQYKMSIEDSTKIWNSYKNIFHKLLPSIVKQYAPTTSYWQSSPSIGWGHAESLTHGDSHYWGVWWGLDSIEKYKQKIPRFMSEYGMQSMPSWNAINKFSLKKDRDTASVVMKVHQKHPTGYQNLKVYVDRMFKVEMDSTSIKNKVWSFILDSTRKKIIDIKDSFIHTPNFEYYVYQTQVVQAEAYKMAIEAHRKHKPNNMGTLLWQLNDPWPTASWSIIDYYGNKKAAYYQVKKSYEPLQIINEKINDTTLKTTVMNETTIDYDSLQVTNYVYNNSGYVDNYLYNYVPFKKNNMDSVINILDTTSERSNNFVVSSLAQNDFESSPYQSPLFFSYFGKFNAVESFFENPKLVPSFNWVGNKIMVTGIRIKQHIKYKYLINGFIYHPTIKNIIAENYSYFSIHRGYSDPIPLRKPITEAAFKKIRLVCCNHPVAF